MDLPGIEPGTPRFLTLANMFFVFALNTEIQRFRELREVSSRRVQTRYYTVGLQALVRTPIGFLRLTPPSRRGKAISLIVSDGNREDN